MKIISIWNQKGGVGKSTLALQLAAGYAASGLKVGIADMDTQKTCLTFFENCKKPDFIVYNGLPKEKPNLDVLICDHSPERSIENDPIGHLVLVPISPSAIDAWSTLPALESLSKRKKIHTLIVVNRFQKSRKLMTEFVGKFAHDFVIYERSIYARSIANFGTVFEPRKLSLFAHGLNEAKKEINELICKIEEKLNELD